ncbi:conserved hypothetical protein [Mesorhizobium prunaredense]|uniref:Uncharacterized protein n=1 Tax=Mesorhizobium prunaredense TaxID=1631249 RepID=A0A1R3V1W0_9HYPH|nr:conserved hypothetical protein [Mesorhizobium prunaredense]
MGTARQPAQHIFGADNGQAQRLQRAVDGGDEHDAAGLEHLAAFGHEQVDVGNMLDHFHVEDDVEFLTGVSQVLCCRGTVIHHHADVGRMQLGHFDVGGGCVGADHFGAKPRHRLAQQPAAAADVEDAQALERPRRAWVAAEARRHLVAYIGKPDRIELVQRAEFAVRIPPFGGESGKTLHFSGIDRRSSGFWHRVVSRRLKSSERDRAQNRIPLLLIALWCARKSVESRRMSRQQISPVARCAYATGIRVRALHSYVAFVAQGQAGASGGTRRHALRNPKHLAKEAANSAAGPARRSLSVFRPPLRHPVKGISLPWRAS